jgi:hypothetical protein
MGRGFKFELDFHFSRRLQAFLYNWQDVQFIYIIFALQRVRYTYGKVGDSNSEEHFLADCAARLRRFQNMVNHRPPRC